MSTIETNPSNSSAELSRRLRAALAGEATAVVEICAQYRDDLTAAAAALGASEPRPLVEPTVTATLSGLDADNLPDIRSFEAALYSQLAAFVTNGAPGSAGTPASAGAGPSTPPDPTSPPMPPMPPPGPVAGQPTDPGASTVPPTDPGASTATVPPTTSGPTGAELLGAKPSGASALGEMLAAADTEPTSTDAAVTPHAGDVTATEAAAVTTTEAPPAADANAAGSTDEPAAADDVADAADPSPEAQATPDGPSPIEAAAMLGAPIANPGPPAVPATAPDDPAGLDAASMASTQTGTDEAKVTAAQPPSIFSNMAAGAPSGAVAGTFRARGEQAAEPGQATEDPAPSAVPTAPPPAHRGPDAPDAASLDAAAAGPKAGDEPVSWHELAPDAEPAATEVDTSLPWRTLVGTLVGVAILGAIAISLATATLGSGPNGADDEASSLGALGEAVLDVGDNETGQGRSGAGSGVDGEATGAGAADATDDVGPPVSAGVPTTASDSTASSTATSGPSTTGDAGPPTTGSSSTATSAPQAPTTAPTTASTASTAPTTASTTPSTTAAAPTTTTAPPAPTTTVGDLSDRVIANVVFTGDDLRNYDFTGSTLTNVTFVGVDLRGADFTGAEFNNVDFTLGTDLSNATVRNVRIRNSSFSSSTLLNNTDFTGSTLGEEERIRGTWNPATPPINVPVGEDD